MLVKWQNARKQRGFLQFNRKISTSVATQGLLYASDSFILAHNIVIYFKVFVLLSRAQKMTGLAVLLSVINWEQKS